MTMHVTEQTASHHVRYHTYLGDNTIRSEYPGSLLAIVYYSMTLSETHRFTGST